MTDISRGRLILTDLVERNSVPIFSSIQAALQCTKILLRRVHVYHTILGPEHFKIIPRERSGSVVEYLTRDRGAVGSSLTGITVLCP